MSARAAAEPPREAVLAASETDAPRAAPEAERAAAEPRPEAATAASERQEAGAAAEEPDVPRAVAAGAERVGPQAAAGVAAELGARARQLAAAERVGGAVQLRAGVWPGARAPQAVQPLAVPSEAASVFRQDQSLAAGPARPREAARLAHAMRSLRIASQ